MSKVEVRKSDLLYPELSYQIIGCAYDVYNELGPGHTEKVYQKAMAVGLQKRDLLYKEQLYRKVEFEGTTVGSGFCDFIVEDKIIVELKKRNNFSISHMDQIFKYLKSTKLKLAIIINFGTEGVQYKRVPNIKPDSNESNVR